jgi:hypothetical protein
VQHLLPLSTNASVRCAVVVASGSPRSPAGMPIQNAPHLRDELTEFKNRSDRINLSLEIDLHFRSMSAHFERGLIFMRPLSPASKNGQATWAVRRNHVTPLSSPWTWTRVPMARTCISAPFCLNRNRSNRYFWATHLCFDGPLNSG